MGTVCGGGGTRLLVLALEMVKVDTERIAETFVVLADTLVDVFAVLDLLHTLTTRCVGLLDVDAAAIILASPSGRLRAAVSTSQRARALDVLQTQDEKGPALECYFTAAPVVVEGLGEMESRWPEFAAQAARHGFNSVVALPMRLRENVIGVLSLLADAGTAPTSGPEMRVAQAMADAATIAILQYRLTEKRRVVSEQLERALDSRVVVEQGKGVLVTRLQVSEDEAFEMLRQRARDTRRRLTEVADEVRRRGPDADWEAYRHPQQRPGAGHDDAGGSLGD